MVDVEQLVDPELEGLLRELASRPRSVFLRTSRKDALRILQARSPEPVSAMSVSDALERELVVAHREELAEILKQACRTRLVTGERERMFNMPFGPSGQRIAVETEDATRMRMVRASNQSTHEPWQGAHAILVHALVGGRQGSPIPYLASLGHRLAPRDDWSIITAISQVASGDLMAAREGATCVLGGAPDEGCRFRALELLALHEASKGSPVKALEYQEEALDVAGDYVLGQMNRMRYGLLALREGAARDAAARLEQMMEPEHPLLVASCRANAQRRSEGAWAPCPQASHLAATMSDTLGPVGRRIAHAIR